MWCQGESTFTALIEWRKNGEGVLENTLRILRGWVNTPRGAKPQGGY